MAKPKKKGDQLTNEEVARKLFPKAAIREMKKIAKKKEPKPKPS